MTEVTPTAIAQTETYAPISDVDIAQKAETLEAVFNKVYVERMHDVPIINDKLAVTAVGFQQWKDSVLGILVTPWFMNIMILPGENENWDDIQELSAKTQYFPSGKYKFLMAYEKDFGRYQICSLFSPMYEFADNHAAVDTAEHAIKELMNVENVEEPDIDSEQIERIWKGEEALPDDVDVKADSIEDEKPEEPPEDTRTLTEKMEEPVSRRDMLRGRLFRNDSSS